MHSRPVTRLLCLAVICAAIVGCASAAVGRGGGDGEPRAVISQASGSLSITNSRNGQAIFQAQGLAPGRAVTGTVQLSNTGTLAGELSLAQVDVLDQPGANGGLLSSGVHLEIQDVTGGSAVPVFAGQLATVGTRAFGTLGAGQSRTYRFTASLPDTGAPLNPTAGDNAYKGSRVSARYVWTATAPDGSGGSGSGGSGGGSGGAGITEEPPRLWLRVDARRLLKKGWLDVFARCNRGCSLDAWARFPKLKGVRVKHRRALLALPGREARLRLKLSKQSRRVLQRAVKTRRRVARVRVKLLAAGWSQTRVYTRTVTVKRPKRRR